MTLRKLTPVELQRTAKSQPHNKPGKKRLDTSLFVYDTSRHQVVGSPHGGDTMKRWTLEMTMRCPFLLMSLAILDSRFSA
jgi:hypothetical protein